MGSFGLLTVNLHELYADIQTDFDPWRQQTCKVTSFVTLFAYR